MNPHQLKRDHAFCVSNELRRGRQATTDLLGLIRQQKALSSANAAVSFHPAFGLVTRIIDSFSNSLSVLGSQDLAIAGGPARVSRKSSALYSGARSRCHNPRKGDSWIQVTSDLTADGYAWRKYGQKPILNAKHPRSYYKCKNKSHCQALKRVQKMDDDPLMYKINHTGHHTCENPSSSSSLISDMASSILIDFEKDNNEQFIKSSDRLATLSSSFRRVKGSEECKNQQHNLPVLEHMEATKSVQWSLDDYDYLIGCVEFNDLHAF